MSTTLDDDRLGEAIRSAFTELAATTPVEHGIAPPSIVTERRAQHAGARHRTMLVAAAVVAALLAGLALLARDGGSEVTPADRGLVDVPLYLFPDGSGPLFDDPLPALEAYFDDRIASRPPDQVATFAVGRRVDDGTADRAVVEFQLEVHRFGSPDIVDIGLGVAVLERVDASWYVSSARTRSFEIDRLRYVGGRVTGSISPTVPGEYEVTVDDLGWPPPASGPWGVQSIGYVPDPDDTSNGFSFGSPGHTAPAVGVRTWETSWNGEPPLAVFGEVLLRDGQTLESGFDVPVDVAPDRASASDSTDPNELSSAPSASPLEAADRYLGEVIASTEELTVAGIVPDVPALTIAPGEQSGRWFDFEIDRDLVTAAPDEAWVRFRLISVSGDRGGVLRLANVGDASRPAWIVTEAGTADVHVVTAAYRDGTAAMQLTSPVAGDRWVCVRYDERGSSGGSSGGSCEQVVVGAGIVEVEIHVPERPTRIAMSVRSAPEVGSPLTPSFGEIGLVDAEERGTTRFGSLLVEHGGGEERDVVPPLIGLTEGQARTVLAEQGFGVDVTYRELAPGDPADGTVIEQSLAAGAEARLGTSISVLVGLARSAEP